MLCHRITRFREYNKIEPLTLAKSLEIDVNEYLEYEAGSKIPDISILTKLSMIYKVTLDEFYGHTPRLALHDESSFSPEKNEEDFYALKFAELSIDEKELILAYRLSQNKERFLKLLEDEEK